HVSVNLRKRRSDVASGPGFERTTHDLHVLLRHRPRSIPSGRAPRNALEAEALEGGLPSRGKPSAPWRAAPCRHKRGPEGSHRAVTNAVLKEALKLVFHPSPELARIALRPEVLGRAGRAADRERDQ